MDRVFHALANGSRRDLLDRLRQTDGLTLGQLCEGLSMSRQAVSGHLAVLEAANLVAVVWRGREKIHHLNPIPIGEIHHRWIGRFEQHRVSALIDLKHALETSPMSQTNFIYSIFIDASPQTVWQALTDGAFTRQYWAGRRISSDWKVGSPVHLKLEDTDEFEVFGEVLEFSPEKRLSYTWRSANEPEAPGSTVVFELGAMADSVHLTVTHGPLVPSAGERQGWAAILSSLKSFLETGRPLRATEVWRRRTAPA